jgi:hypothetical protein
VPEIGEHDIQIAVAVQVGHAGSVVIWAASIDASGKVVKVQTTRYSDQQVQEQQSNLYPSGTKDRL